MGRVIRLRMLLTPLKVLLWRLFRVVVIFPRRLLRMTAWVTCFTRRVARVSCLRLFGVEVWVCLVFMRVRGRGRLLCVCRRNGRA